MYTEGEFKILATGYWAGLFDASKQCIYDKMPEDFCYYMIENKCPPKLLLSLIESYFEELDVFYEQCDCGKLLDDKYFFDEDEFDQHPDRDAGYDEESKWFCSECR